MFIDAYVTQLLLLSRDFQVFQGLEAILYWSERAVGTKLKRVWTVWTRSWQVGTALTTGTAQALSSARVEVNNQLSGSTSAESCVKQLFFICFCALSQTLEKGCMVVRLSRCLQENESKARWRICEVPWELQLDCKQRLPSVCLQMLHASLCSTRLVAPRIIQTSMKKHR